jgi:hypothetical protein
MDITPLHWECFRLGNQEKKSAPKVAEILDIEVDEVKRLLKELRASHPQLFPCEREYLRFGQQNMPRDGYKLLPITDIDENEIKYKF